MLSEKIFQNTWPKFSRFFSRYYDFSASNSIHLKWKQKNWKNEKHGHLQQQQQQQQQQCLTLEKKCCAKAQKHDFTAITTTTTTTTTAKRSKIPPVYNFNTILTHYYHHRRQLYDPTLNNNIINLWSNLVIANTL